MVAAGAGLRVTHPDRCDPLSGSVFCRGSEDGIPLLVQVLSAVVTTGIYCRPGCGGRPLPDHVRPYTLAAAAEADGFRPCLRCRPYRSAQAVPWSGSELVCRAVQLITDGALDGHTEGQLASRLGISSRHLRRLFIAELGVTPDALARSRRAHFARRLLDDTDLPVADVAFAAGFGSVRQLHRACHDIFRAAPGELRARRRRTDRLVADGGLALRMPYHGDLDWTTMLAYFQARAIPGVEYVEGDTYRRTVLVDGDPGVLELGPGGPDHLVVRAHLPHWEGLIHVVQGARRIASLDADLDIATRDLARDPVLAPMVAARPGLRVPGTWDPFETGVRAILGQQVSVAGATTVAGRLVAQLGAAVPGLAPMGLTHTFPDPATLAEAELSDLGLTRARQQAISAFARAVADGAVRLDRSAGLDQLLSSLTAIPGLGPWTAHYIALRLGEPDAFPATDLGVRKALARSDSGSAEAAAEPWRPWRALATAHLWAASSPGPAHPDQASLALAAG
jgi:AraC family transcriptional regulator of adaptative response / DNA-3-methyladenine glycosylase II